MMATNPHRRTALLFGSLTLYIVLQFVWWAVLLLRKDRALAALTLELKALGSESGVPVDPQRSLMMVVGEGSVFLVLLLAVLYLTYRAIRRDLDLARTQRNFLLAVTHELRTPIAAIKLQLQTLARPALDGEQRETLRMRAIQEADRLALLTDKVLLATSAEEGVLAMDRREVDVMELLRMVVERARTHWAKDHTISLVGPDTLLVHSDQQALHSIVENLLENAAKYAPQGSPIEVRVEAGREGWRILVSDEGPGVPVEERERIFEKFFRGGHEETRKAKGTGLGLYIVRRLTQALGGNVQLNERRPHGATFAASFPNH
ncbi:MAG: HAMP domain-containing sensor histidine kinase [Flavobacteriales bacterium]